MENEGKKLFQFPRQESRVWDWYIKYKHIRKSQGQYEANSWLVGNVPRQFHQQIHVLFRYYSMKRKNKGDIR